MNVPLHQQQNKCTTLVKNKTAAAATALQFTYPLFTTNACSTSGNSSLAQAQVGVAQARPKGGRDSSGP